MPSECGRRIENGSCDLGIVPVVEMQRQQLVALEGTGIACDGPVRSILLISNVEPGRIRTLAADSGSRTSVMLARIILRHRYKCEPRTAVMDPDLREMLASADAALLIGDAALRVEPAQLHGHVLDLGAEWCAMTGLPMVFALWAGKQERVAPLLDAGFDTAFRESLEFGQDNINTIVDTESRSRGFTEQLVGQYLTRHIVFRIGAREREGMERFLRHALEFEAHPVV